MKVLVTGGTGFIGKFLLDFLLKQNVSITVLVRNINHTLPESVKQHIGDLTCPNSLIGIGKNIDCVFHLGGYAHAWQEQSTDEARQHEEVNLLGTKYLLEECRKDGVKKFIFFSSIKAVGDAEHCIDEKWTVYPSTPYGQAKRAAEESAIAMGKTYNMHVCILRLALVYGPGWKGNLYQMLKAVDKGYFLPIPPIKNHRSLVSVYDVCQAAWLAANNTNANGKIYFVSDKHSYSTYDIYTEMRYALGKPSLKWHFPLIFFKFLAVFGDVFEKIFKKRFPINTQAIGKLFGSTQCSSERIQKELGFSPRHPLQQLLPEIVQRYRTEQP